MFFKIGGPALLKFYRPRATLIRYWPACRASSQRDGRSAGVG